MAGTLLPNTEQVVTAWLKSVGFSKVGATLPEDVSQWATDGFLQVTPVGGTPGLYVPIARPVVQLDFWAANTNSAKAPKQRANQYAEQVRQACYQLLNVGVSLVLPDPYKPARIMTAYFLSEPRPIPDPNASYAHYQCDLQVNWTF